MIDRFHPGGAEMTRVNASRNPSFDGLKVSATLAISQKSHERKQSGQEVFALGFGQSPFPVPAHVVEALRRHAAAKAYLPVQGLAELRRAICGYHAQTRGLTVHEDQVLVGPGSKELMFVLQLVLDAELLIPSPSWVSYAPQARILDRPVRWLDTHGPSHLLMPDTLEEALGDGQERSRLLILNTPNNPTGTVLEADHLEALAAVARRHGVVVLSDEIYSGLHHRGDHVSIACYYPEGTIVSDGLSKWCGAGGWRLGFFVVPKELQAIAEAMAIAGSEMYSCATAPVQWAAVTALEEYSVLGDYLEGSRTILSILSQELVSILGGVASIPHPGGGFYLFPDFSPCRDTLLARGISDSNELCTRLLDETGVALLPGSHFGRPDTELAARLSYVDFDGAAALRSLEFTDAATVVAKHCHRVLEGARLIQDWVRAGG
jgi:aspartate aminotransferase